VLEERKYVNSISGCNALYRRQDLLNVGGFNVNLSINEDTEINRRLLKKGKLLYVPEAIVVHDQGRGVGKFSKRMFLFGYGRGKNRLPGLQVIPPVLLLLAIVLSLFHPYFLIVPIFLYLIVVAAFTLLIVYDSRKIAYLFTVPIVYFAEHLSYAIGFWIGLAGIRLAGIPGSGRR
jgi:GT2 family glycosyltransferase